MKYVFHYTFTWKFSFRNESAVKLSWSLENISQPISSTNLLAKLRTGMSSYLLHMRFIPLIISLRNEHFRSKECTQASGYLQARESKTSAEGKLTYIRRSPGRAPRVAFHSTLRTVLLYGTAKISHTLSYEIGKFLDERIEIIASSLNLMQIQRKILRTLTPQGRDSRKIITEGGGGGGPKTYKKYRF